MVRSAAQRAATRRMIAANRAARRGGPASNMARKGRRSARRSGGSARRRGASRTVNLGHELGGPVVLIGAVDPVAALGSYGIGPGSGTARASPFSNGFQNSPSNVIYNLKQNLPILGTDPLHAGQRAEVAVGLLGLYGDRIPIISTIGRKLKFKSGRKTYRLW